MTESVRALVFGGANVDIQAKSGTPLRAADSNPGSVSIHSGGVGRNVAENLARLGASVEFSTVLGDDSASDRIVAELRTLAVEVHGCVRRPGRRCPTYVAILDADGALSMAVADMDLVDSIDSAAFGKSINRLPGAHVCVIDANLPAAVVMHVISARGPTPVVLDTVSVSKANRFAEPGILAGVSAVKTNVGELRVLTGRGGSGLDRNADLAREVQVLHSLGPTRIFVSLGRDGILGSELTAAGEQVVVKATAPRGEVVNVSGAGDAQTALVALGVACGWPLDRIVRCAAAAAAITVASEAPVNPEMSLAAVESTASAEGVR